MQDHRTSLVLSEWFIDEIAKDLRASLAKDDCVAAFKDLAALFQRHGNVEANLPYAYVRGSSAYAPETKHMKWASTSRAEKIYKLSDEFQHKCVKKAKS